MSLSTKPCIPPIADLSSPLDFPNTPKSHSRPITASQILALFSPKIVTKSKSPSQSPSSRTSHPIIMEEPRRVSRAKPRVSYEISSDSETAGSPSALDSSFSSPEKPSGKRTGIIQLEEDEEIEEIEPPRTPPPRVSTAGHSLRQHSNLHLSLRAQENGDRHRIVKKKKSYRRSSGMSKPKPSSPAAQMTERNAIRHQISTVTAAKRANFFIAKKDLFLPLLPEGNHVARLADQRCQLGHDAADLTIPYEALEAQPTGFAISEWWYVLNTC